jgi:hypothetical protein
MTGAIDRGLLLLIWGIGQPLLVLGCIFGIPRAFAAHDRSHQLAWAALPAIGFVAIVCGLIAIQRRGSRTGTAVFERRWLGRYYLEVYAAIAIYILLAVICLPLVHSVGSPTAQLLLALAPGIGVLGMAIAIARWILSADEYQRQRLLEAVAVGGAITAVWTMIYGFLEQVGFPRLSMFWVWPVMALTWGAWSLIIKLRHR